MKIDTTNAKAISELCEELSVEPCDHEKDDDELHEMYDNMLEECCTCETCGKGGSNLKDDDPIAYRCGFNDYLDSELKSDQLFQIDDVYLTEEGMGDLCEELKDAIEELF
jgi:hypothetical protein